MGVVLQFPKLVDGVPLDTSKTRIKALERRLGELENRITHYQEDMDYIHQCMTEDSHEMGHIIGELAQIHGFDESQEHIAEELERWLHEDKGDNHEDR